MCRRESFLNPQDSDKRRACFLRRLTLIEASHQHDLGDDKTARSAVMTMSPAPSRSKPQRLPQPSRQRRHADQAARVRALKAEWHVRRNRDGPPPQYFGANALHLAANQAMHDSRVSNQARFGCTPAQIKAAPPGQLH